MQTSSADAVRRFADDLRAVREAREVPLEQLYAVSRIPLDVLRDFERTGLADNRMFNRVYLRSLVRTYADAVRLPAPPVLSALDAALDGRYEGEIAALSASGPRDPAPVSEPVEDSPAEADAAAPLETALPESPGEEGKGDEAVEVPEEDPTPAGAALEADASPVAGLRPDEPPAPARRRVREPVMPPSYSPVIPSPDPGHYSYEPERQMPGWARALIGLVALIAIGGGLTWWLTRDDEAARPVTDPSRPVATRPDSARPQTPAAPVTLPDTLRLVVQATGGPVRAIRITVDQEVRRPYWIEQGEQQAFAFRDSIRVDDPPSAATITVQGRPLAPSAWSADSSRAVVRRADLTRGR
jgi:hypothetical protein